MIHEDQKDPSYAQPSLPEHISAMAGVSRRAFLQHGGAALAGLSLALQHTAAADKPSKNVRVGIVGGGFGTSFQFHRPEQKKPA